VRKSKHRQYSYAETIAPRPYLCVMFDVKGIFAGMAIAHVNPEQLASEVLMRLTKQQSEALVPAPFSLRQEEGRGIGFVSLIGPMMKNSSFFGYGADNVISQLYSLYSDSSVESIVMRIDSGGGEASAGFSIAQAVASRNKPIVVHTDYAASAAYLVASAADEIIVAPQYSQVGGLGAVYVIDVSQVETNKVKFIRSAISPRKNIGAEKALTGDYTEMQKTIDDWGAMLADTIAKYRFRSDNYRNVERFSEIMSGDIFNVEQAKALGLADSVGNIEYAIRRAKKINKYAK